MNMSPRLRTSTPILNLEEVELISQSSNPAHDYFHFFGIFKKEVQYACGTCWTLLDELKEINVKLNGDLAGYIRPKSGDIIRVHRAKINTVIRLAEIPVSKNVVIWSAFDEEPEPKSVAKQPTIGKEDLDRCKELQLYYTSQITRISELSKQSGTGTSFLTLAGRLEDKLIDSFGHLEIKFTDGTGDSSMRIYNKIAPVEDDVHFIVARDMKVGEYFIANNVKYDRSSKKIQLSANRLYGRSFRHVAKRSILGIILSAALRIDIEEEPQGRRRSPRIEQLQQQQSLNQHPQQTQQPTMQPQILQQPLKYKQKSNNNRDEADRSTSDSESIPTYKSLSDIVPKGAGYDFFDIVGQVRAEPLITNTYNNCILQIYDGSKHEHLSFYSQEVERVLPGCVLVQIYSKQKEDDTDEHIEKAKRLKEGELIFIKNVKVSFKGGKLKLELSANKNHDKSLNVIDKNSDFGKILLDIIENPIVEEFDGVDESNLSESIQCAQHTDSFLMDIS